jgi:CubicO group peptidase (beta-lactamase class C family)
VTTSVVSILVGIAIGRGDIEDLTQPLGTLLPNEADRMSPAVRALTLRRLLTQTAGFRDDAAAWTYALHGKRVDWVTSALRSRTSATRRFQDSDAGAHLVAAIVEETTGRPLLAFARQVLFRPLGITDVTWARDPEGHPLGFSGLRLTPTDLAKIGQLMLDEGRWHGAQVVPLEWTRESTSTQIAFQQLVEPSGEYGFGWWVFDAGRDPAYAATDSTGQLLEVVPDERLVVVLSTRITDVSLVGVGGPLSWVANLLIPALHQTS